MFDFLRNHFDAIITIILTAIGFIITNVKTNRDFKNEVMKNKLAINVDTIKTLPYDICQLMNKASKSSQDVSVDEISAILSKVISYGSKDAVSIAVSMQEMTYKFTSEKNKESLWPLLASYSLLISQIKYDLTSMVTSPESWFRIKITDYHTKRDDIVKVINKLVHELKLNKEFLC
ncbi:MAG: hypothetical protein ABFD03_01860 [Clostridiaceae bacterium]